MKYLLSILIILISFSLVTGQLQMDSTNQNIQDISHYKAPKLYFTLGTILVAFRAGINLETPHLRNKKGNIHYLLNCGIGHSIFTLSFITERSGFNAFIGPTFLIGSEKKNKFFELGVNYTYTHTSSSYYQRHYPGGALGYRHQSPKSLFRVGLGFPELIYISFGGTIAWKEMKRIRT